MVKIMFLFTIVVFLLQGCSQVMIAKEVEQEIVNNEINQEIIDKSIENPYLYPQCLNNPKTMDTKLSSPLRNSLCNEKLESNFLVHFDDNRIQVYVKLEIVNDNIINKLKQNGLEIEIVNEDLLIIQGWISAYGILDIEKFEEVKRISPPSYAVNR